MAVVQLNNAFLKLLKRSFREQMDASSSHLTEAIARGCGYRTHAALQAAASGTSGGRYLSFDIEAFRGRLSELAPGAHVSALEIPSLDQSARYVVRWFEDEAIEVVEFLPMSVGFRLRGIPTVITIRLEPIADGYTRFHRSHAIHTPSQIGPYRPSRDFDDEAAYAMNRAIKSIVDYYLEAVRAGHTPRAEWLVPSSR
ncbi:hypothetical protein [Agrobacterium tumefaciens]|uniref:hypothetical protein n=1 Tax=Agrobacterium tumefaciens TaxID=358 RepID=UPI000471AA4E